METAKLGQTAKVGQEVDSWCTRCKLMLAHTVEAMVGTKITRVHCKTCRAQHAYRRSAPGLRASSTGSATARRRSASAGRGLKAVPAALQASDYPRVMHGREASSARRYGLQERFVPTELIAHPTFGLGVVMAARDGTKIEVLFSDGPKTLVHGR